MIDAKADLAITLQADEWNVVLDVLGDGPFKKVSPLIQKIIQQAQAQENRGQEAAQGLPRLQPVS